MEAPIIGNIGGNLVPQEASRAMRGVADTAASLDAAAAAIARSSKLKVRRRGVAY